MKKIICLMIFTNFIFTRQKKGSVEDMEPEEWLKTSKENFDPTSWENSTDLETMEHVLYTVDTNNEVFCFLYNQKDLRTYSLLPFFKSSSNILSNKEKHIQKISFDMNKNPIIAKYFHIDPNYAAILFFYKGSAHLLNLEKLNANDKSIHDMIKEIRKKSFGVKRIYKKEQSFILEDGNFQIILVVGEFNKQLIGIFEGMAYSFPEYEFTVLVRSDKTEEVEQKLNEDYYFKGSKQNRLLILRHDDEEFFEIDLSFNSFAEMFDQISLKRFSKVKLLTEESFNGMFSEQKPTAILFMKQTGRVLQSFKKITKELPNVNALYTDLSISHKDFVTTQLLTILGIDIEDAPVLTFLPFKPPQNGIIPKYKTHKLTVKGMKDFIEKSINGDWEVYKKSEFISNNDLRKDGFTRISTNNFEDIVLNNDKHVFVVFNMFKDQTADEHLTKEIGLLDKVIKKYNVQDDIEIGVCDIYKNEVNKYVNLKSFPTLTLFKKGQKTQQIDYTGRKDYQEIGRWLREQTGIHFGRSSLNKNENEEKQNEADKENEDVIDDEL